MVLLRVCVVGALVLTSIGQVTVLKVEGKVETVMEKVVKQHLNGCHLVFLTTTTHSPLASSIIRQLGVVGVVADVTMEGGDRLWGDQRTTCRAAILLTHNNNNNNTNLLLRHLERIGLYKRSEVVVVAVGLREDVERVLLHPSLRNTAHALYLAFTPHTTPISTLIPHSTSTSAPHTTSHETGEGVFVYRRCLYCDNGKATYSLLTSSGISRSRVEDDSCELLPLRAFVRETEEPQTPVTFTDSLDVRIFQTFTKKLNISYKVTDAPNRTWGADKDGVFFGMMGKLQREEADLCTSSGPTRSRFKVIDYLRIHPSDHMIVTSLQPALLPQHLAIVRPFSDGVWLSLLVGVVGWSVIMWTLQLVWTRMVAEGGRGISFSMALMYGWGALLEQTHPDPSLSVSGQLLVGWWLVFCVVITTGFRSSLVAHLTVQGKTAPIDSFEDMVAQKGWRWGTEETLFKGAPVEYFTISHDPVVQKANSILEILGWKDGLRKVQEGGYSFFAFRNFIRFTVGSHFTDANGRSPFYIGKRGLSAVHFLGWDGAPFYPRFSELMHYLEDAGLRAYWIEQVLDKRIRETRQGILLYEEESQQVALKLGHMQGAFYLFFLGVVLAFLVLLLETIFPPRNTSKQLLLTHSQGLHNLGDSVQLS
ncbi:hypothetical protein Pcinc_002200 [Petrolisthes cinctipes]|uniref:Ionotropic glutamate receptor C-terminal domain-containing protein n=1 Tax=Petrolisthes cinctipes TaxID=88211 RepID=A0AAE1GIN2_PETCI|nr:hypothetical protein Pcinc_002200 [Petrolisthes cinctipes]